MTNETKSAKIQLEKRKGEKKMTIKEMIETLKEIERQAGDVKVTIENEENFEIYLDCQNEVSIYLR